MPHPESLRLQAYFDGEVDAVAAAEIEQHIEECVECGALLQELDQTRTVLRQNLPFHRAPAELRRTLERALDAESGPRSSPRDRWDRLRLRIPSFWAGAVSGGAVAAVAAFLAFAIWMPPPTGALADAVTSAHVRSLMSGNPIDVVSTDKHTVKPWFAGHTDVSPVVADFEPQGYKLIGGRADYLNHQRAAVIVYKHGPHVIDVFSWAAARRSLPGSTTVDGYHVLCWKAVDMEYCAVSDTAADELLKLVQLLQDAGARDAPN